MFLCKWSSSVQGASYHILSCKEAGKSTLNDQRVYLVKLSCTKSRPKDLYLFLQLSVLFHTLLTCLTFPFLTGKNHLFGTIPSEVGDLINLNVFEIDNNALTGTIPTELGNLIKLVELDLDDNELIGTIPTEFGLMINARELDLGKSEALTLQRSFHSQILFTDFLQSISYFLLIL